MIRSSLALMALVACAPTPSSLDGATGAKLQLDYAANTDVVGFHLSAERIACDAYDSFVPQVVTATADLVDGGFPGGVSLLDDTSFSTEAGHAGADLLLTLDAGCWHVVATPASSIDGDVWEPSEDCGTAESGSVRIYDGLVTDVVLMSQCEGQDRGALDAVVHLNHPPVVIAEWNRAATSTCELEELCVLVVDPDDDPVEVSWDLSSGPSLFQAVVSDPVVVDFDEARRVWRSCVTVATRGDGGHLLEATAWDRAWRGGAPIRLEEVLGQPSSGSATVSLSSIRQDEPRCIDAWDREVDVPGVSLDLAPWCAPISDKDWYCSGLYPSDPSVAERVCTGSTLWPEKLYPDCLGGGE